MPIAKPQTIVSKPDQVIARDSAIAPQRVVATDTRYESKQSLLPHVSGSKWVVTYYRQLLDKDNAGEAFNIDRRAPHQQYIKINNFEFRVTSPLQHSPTNDNSSSMVSGTATIYPSIVPTPGDTFIADIGDGRAGYFNIREVTQKSYLKDTTYEIEYDLTDYVTIPVLDALKACTVQETVYERAFANYGANPVLEVDQYRIYKELLEWQYRIANHYFDSFFNYDHGTFLVPVEGMALYDPFLTNFLTRIWNEEIIPNMRYLRTYGYDSGNTMGIRTIWDTLLKMDPYSLMNVKDHFYIIPVRLFDTGNAIYTGVQYSRLDALYHPATMKDGSNNTIVLPNSGSLKVSSIYSTFSTLRDLNIKMLKLPGLGFVHDQLKDKLPIPDAKKYGSFDTYVFSPAFYEKDRATMSKVERFVMDALEEKPVDANQLMPILKDCINWDDMSRFYYIPVLVVLSKIAMGDLSQ